MDTTKFKDFLKHNWFFVIFAGTFAFMGLKICVEDIIIERNGITVSVKVEYYDKIRFSKGGRQTVSRGFYYVNYRKHSCFSREILPIGSTFKIKYNPNNPEVYRRVEE